MKYYTVRTDLLLSVSVCLLGVSFVISGVSDRVRSKKIDENRELIELQTEVLRSLGTKVELLSDE